MTDLSQFVGEDSRAPIQRLRRFQLWKIADEMGLQYPVGASKDMMIKLFEANSVDVTQSRAVNWRVTNGLDAHGNPRQEMYPIVPPGASQRNGVNADVVLGQKLSEQAEEEKRFSDAQIKALQAENAKLRQQNEQLVDVMERRLAALEGAPAKPKAESGGYWEVYRKARDLGFKNLRGKKLHELEAMIENANGQDAT